MNKKLVTLYLIIGAYVAVSFIAMSVNFASWDAGMRFIFMVGVSAAIAYYCIEVGKKEENVPDEEDGKLPIFTECLWEGTYPARLFYDAEKDKIVGRPLDSNIPLFYGTSLRELKREFRAAVNDYLENIAE